ncbi:hypothetical protein TSUD_47090 [Trifolium subterraneum]|nr:hypothetical protein TSUD_47090 [Trifolium subterraneum]
MMGLPPMKMDAGRCLLVLTPTYGSYAHPHQSSTQCGSLKSLHCHISHEFGPSDDLVKEMNVGMLYSTFVEILWRLLEINEA